MANEPNFIKNIDGKRDDSVNLRVGVPNQSIVDINNYGTEAVLTNTDTGETTQLTGEYHPELFGVKYDIPIELVSERAKYILDIDGHAFSVYVTKRSIEHVLTDDGVFYFAGAASDGEGDEDMALIVNATWNNEDVTTTLDKTFKEIKDAMLSGKLVYVITQPYTWTRQDSEEHHGYSVDVVTTLHDEVDTGTGEHVSFTVGAGGITFASIAETDYPVYHFE